jgi:hypothetical protein
LQELLSEKQQFVLKFLESAVNFIEQIHSAIPIACQLLGSKNTSDITEAIDFFVTAFSFNIQAAQDGVRKMLMLIWSGEPAVKEKVIDAFYQLYVNKDDSKKVARNLIRFAQNLNRKLIQKFDNPSQSWGTDFFGGVDDRIDAQEIDFQYSHPDSLGLFWYIL